MSRPPDPEITKLLLAWRQGDTRALDALMPWIYDELKRRARHYLRNERDGFTLQTTDLVHEVYFRLIDADQKWEGRNHFLAIAAKKIREFLVDRAKAKHALKRGGGYRITHLAGDVQDPNVWSEVLILHNALEALDRKDPRRAKILEMRYFGGMLNAEVAEELEVSVSTVERELRLALAWLKSDLSDENGSD